jgi:hypothetical protein
MTLLLQFSYEIRATALSQVLSPVFEGRNVSQSGVDYRGAKGLEVSRKIENGNLALIAKIDLTEATGESGQLTSTFHICGTLYPRAGNAAGNDVRSLDNPTAVWNAYHVGYGRTGYITGSIRTKKW